MATLAAHTESNDHGMCHTSHVVTELNKVVGLSRTPVECFAKTVLFYKNYDRRFLSNTSDIQ